MFLNEGQWQTDNGRLSYFEDGNIVSNQYFRDANGRKLGDTPNDIEQIDDNRLAIALNWSNIIQFIDTKGKALAATEDVPNNRCMVSDGQYLYVTSYAHDISVNGSPGSFVHGFVAKIDLTNYRVADAVEVGYEPEGIALYDGHLFVANSGGYAFQEDHDYERTVSIIDASKMKVTRTVDAGTINLYGVMSRAGQYLCINSSGDYYEVDPCTVIFDCRAALDGKPDAQCRVVLAPPLDLQHRHYRRQVHGRGSRLLRHLRRVAFLHPHHRPRRGDAHRRPQRAVEPSARYHRRRRAGDAEPLQFLCQPLHRIFLRY